jgi:hypothetical protein
MKKAEVLIEALPYIQKYNRKIIVVKYGGSAMESEEFQKNVIKDVTLLKLLVAHGTAAVFYNDDFSVEFLNIGQSLHQNLSLF